MKMRPFTKDDWESFAGCESMTPYMCNSVEVLTVIKGEAEKYKGVCVRDGKSVEFYVMYEDEDGETYEADWHKEFATEAEAKFFCEHAPDRWNVGKLLDFGFEDLMAQP